MKEVNRRLSNDVLSKHIVPDSLGRKQSMIIVSEYGIYETVFESRKKEAKEFKRWVYEMLKSLRQSSGLEGFQIFRMLDKDHQKEMMSKLNTALRKPVRVDFIKANTIANKAISNMYGYPKMIKKENMTPEMLAERQPILEDTVNLMGLADKYGMEVKVSQCIYNGLFKKKIG
jgi:prophage antirepressor-like protein